MQYTVNDLVRLAKRDNNRVRPYLYVNPLQGKHMPARPKDVQEMCRTLANIVKTHYPTERLYVIGFAETATGIAAMVSHCIDNVLFYQNTTREYDKDKEYIYFTESHSHATNQMLSADGVLSGLKQVDRVLFIDDEVTTGNTIIKLIKQFQENYQDADVQFSIVSILNSMSEERKRELKLKKIDCLYLYDIPFEYQKESIMDIEYDSEINTIIHPTIFQETEMLKAFKIIDFTSGVDVRGLVRFKEYDEENNRFADVVAKKLGTSHYNSLLVLGTEEFMYPAFCLGLKLEKQHIADEIKIHATTRSPIIASDVSGYPLYQRYQLRSFYDENRMTFLYNLKDYDQVIIVTDAPKERGNVSDLICALKRTGNHTITLARWN